MGMWLLIHVLISVKACQVCGSISRPVASTCVAGRLLLLLSPSQNEGNWETWSIYRPHFYQTRSTWSMDQGSNENHSLSTISPLQLPNFVSCGRDKPSHVTQNLVTVGTKLWTADRFLVDPWNCWQESDFHLILDPWIKLIWFDKSGAG